jgi:hypothetical protein
LDDMAEYCDDTEGECLVSNLGSALMGGVGGRFIAAFCTFGAAYSDGVRCSAAVWIASSCQPDYRQWRVVFTFLRLFLSI